MADLVRHYYIKSVKAKFKKCVLVKICKSIGLLSDAHHGKYKITFFFYFSFSLAILNPIRYISTYYPSYAM